MLAGEAWWPGRNWRIPATRQASPHPTVKRSGAFTKTLRQSEGNEFDMAKARLRWQALLATGAILGVLVQVAEARDLKIVIPRHGETTPVQRLNRRGVEAIQHHDYAKAEALFYKAYLYDPSDPFTLNNLGYVSELDGRLSRAEHFYKLASEQGCNAVIDRSSVASLKGKPMTDAFSTFTELPMRVNGLNIQAMDMLKEGHPFEAQGILEKALKLEPHNAFTLENLGVAAESAGNYWAALQYYDAAAATGSHQPIVISLGRGWEGKPVSEAASESAARLRKRMSTMNRDRVEARMLALRGVAEVNQNDPALARQDFLRSYSLDPTSAFALNNRAYVAEMDGDPETAQFYYWRALKAENANARIGLATNAADEGRKLEEVARVSNSRMNSELHAYKERHRGQPGRVKLIPIKSTSDASGSSQRGTAMTEPSKPQK